jgi:hypothetical protein
VRALVVARIDTALRGSKRWSMIASTTEGIRPDEFHLVESLHRPR